MTKKALSIHSLVLITSTLISAFIFYTEFHSVGISDCFLLIPYVPLCYGLLFFFLIPPSFSWGPGTVTLNIVLFLRYDVFPLLLCLDNFYVPQKVPTAHYELATLLTIAEMLVLFITLHFYSYKKDHKRIILKRVLPHRVFPLLFILISLYIAIIYIFPDVFANRHFVLNSTLISSEKEEISAGIWGIIIQWIERLIILLIISIILSNKKGKRMWLCFLVLMAPCLFYTGSSRLSLVIPALVALYMLLRIYPHRKKIILSSISVYLLFCIVILTAAKSYKVENLRDLEVTCPSAMVNEYFSGVSNIAIGLKTKEIFGDRFSVITMINDMFRNGMGYSSLFSSDNNSIYYYNATIYGLHIKRGDQIPPTQSQSIWYFGLCFFWVLPFIMARVTLWADKKFHSAHRLETLWLFATMGCTIGWAVPASFQHLYMFIHYTFIPLGIIIILIPFGSTRKSIYNETLMTI